MLVILSAVACEIKFKLIFSYIQTTIIMVPLISGSWIYLQKYGQCEMQCDFDEHKKGFKGTFYEVSQNQISSNIIYLISVRY